MPLHPRIAAALEAAEKLPAYHTLPLREARAMAKAGYPPRIPPIAVRAVADRQIEGPGGAIPVRIYWPRSNGQPATTDLAAAPSTPAGHEQPAPNAAQAGLLPLVVFFHGSGFVVLDLDTHDDICRRLANGTQSVVVSVDYRLAPEHKFPAAPDDCLAATRWAAAHAEELGVDAARIAVAGDSAGACLAAVTASRVRDEGGPLLAAQLHFYPVTDYYAPPTPSYAAFAEGYGLSAVGMRWFWDHYLERPVQADDPIAAPLRAKSMIGLPPAFVLTAEFDVLRDEGEAYARRLSEAGVPATLRRCEGLNHGFLKWTDQIDAVDEAVAMACGWLRQRLADPPRVV